jgi:hypothetical protein
MTGDWRNTNSESPGIRRVQVTARDGGLTVRPVSAGGPAPGDWGEALAGSIFADGMRSDHGMAWTARFRAASGWESHLQANVNLGLLVLAAFHAAPCAERAEGSERTEGSERSGRPERFERSVGGAGSGRAGRSDRSAVSGGPGQPCGSSYFAREFYRRAGGPAISEPGPDAGPGPGRGAGDGDGPGPRRGAGDGLGPGAGPGDGTVPPFAAGGGGAVDPRPLLGTWHNTNPGARGIARIVLRESAAFTCQVLGVGAQASSGSSGPPIDWGPVPATPFAHDSQDREAMAFSAAYDFGFQQVELQANVKQGVLVVASFNRFAASDPRSSYFTREFFYR